MKIDTTSIRKYAKAFGTLYQKGSRLGEHVLLDFEEAKMVMTNPVTNIVMRAPITISSFEDPVNKFFVSQPQFFTLCEEYEELEIVETKNGGKEFISPRNEKFSIAHYEDEDFSLPKSFEDVKMQEISEPDQNFLFEATDYAGEDATEGVIVYDKAIISSDRTVIFEHTGLSKDYESINISIPALNLIKSIYAEEYKIGKVDNSYLMLSFDDELQCLYPMSSKDMPEEYYDGALIPRAFHESTFGIQKSELVESLKFLAPFVKNVTNERLSFKIEDNELIFSTTGESTAERKIEIEEFDPTLEGYTFIVSRTLFNRCVKTIHDDTVTVHCLAIDPTTDPNSKVIGLTGKSDKTTKTIMVRLPE